MRWLWTNCALRSTRCCCYATLLMHCGAYDDALRVHVLLPVLLPLPLPCSFPPSAPAAPALAPTLLPPLPLLPLLLLPLLLSLLLALLLLLMHALPCLALPYYFCYAMLDRWFMQRPPEATKPF
jgi:hypothetical protein